MLPRPAVLTKQRGDFAKRTDITDRVDYTEQVARSETLVWSYEDVIQQSYCLSATLPSCTPIADMDDHGRALTSA